MSQWAADEIKNLRLRMGWSAADFSRRFGCRVELVLDWEKGVQRPSLSDLLQLDRLEFHVESYCEQVQRGSTADRMLSVMGLEQICQTDIRDLNKES